jgi:hypothetical protein
MPEVVTFADGGYRYVKGVFQYSGGVAAEPGFAIERVRFAAPRPLADGFGAVAAHLARRGRPPVALCAFELRSPAPFTEEGFVRFNKRYVSQLEAWGLYRDGVNPVARTNVCPAVDPPAEPAVYAFCYTVSGDAPAVDFVVAGSGEAPEGKGNYRDHAVRLGDRSTEGLREKARWVLGEMERRMTLLGADWRRATGTHLYTVYDIHPFMESELVRRGAMRMGLGWHYARPPVQDLDFEMDVRGVRHEFVL